MQRNCLWKSGINKCTTANRWLDCYAGWRINSHLFVPYHHRFWLTDFFSTFVRNLNFNNFIGLMFGLDEQWIPAQRQAPDASNFPDKLLNENEWQFNNTLLLIKKYQTFIQRRTKFYNSIIFARQFETRDNI